MRIHVGLADAAANFAVTAAANIAAASPAYLVSGLTVLPIHRLTKST